MTILATDLSLNEVLVMCEKKDHLTSLSFFNEERGEKLIVKMSTNRFRCWLNGQELSWVTTVKKARLG
jgi:hypothetical protein